MIDEGEKFVETTTVVAFENMAMHATSHHDIAIFIIIILYIYTDDSHSCVIVVDSKAFVSLFQQSQKM